MTTYNSNYLFTDEFNEDLKTRLQTGTISEHFIQVDGNIKRIFIERVAKITDETLRICKSAIYNRQNLSDIFTKYSFENAMKTAKSYLDNENKDIAPDFKRIFCYDKKVQCNVYVTRVSRANIYDYMQTASGVKAFDDTSTFISFSDDAFRHLAVAEYSMIYAKYFFVERELLRYALLYLSFRLFSYYTFPFDRFNEMLDSIVNEPNSWTAVENQLDEFSVSESHITEMESISPVRKRTRKKTLKREIIEMYRKDKNALVSDLHKYETREDFYADMKERYDIGERTLREIARNHGLNRIYNVN